MVCMCMFWSVSISSRHNTGDCLHSLCFPRLATTQHALIHGLKQFGVHSILLHRTGHYHLISVRAVVGELTDLLAEDRTKKKKTIRINYLRLRLPMMRAPSSLNDKLIWPGFGVLAHYYSVNMLSCEFGADIVAVDLCVRTVNGFTRNRMTWKWIIKTIQMHSFWWIFVVAFVSFVYSVIIFVTCSLWQTLRAHIWRTWRRRSATATAPTGAKDLCDIAVEMPLPLTVIYCSRRARSVRAHTHIHIGNI